MNNKIITISIILIILVASIMFLLFKKKSSISEELANCIGQNSLLYVQEGCHYCEQELEKFGDNKKFLKLVDCVSTEELAKYCFDQNITATPTWEINGEFYTGVKSIQELKELTGC